jgi:hypothetical protein
MVPEIFSLPPFIAPTVLILTEKALQWLTSSTKIKLPAVTHFKSPEHMVLCQTDLTSVEYLRDSSLWLRPQKQTSQRFTLVTYNHYIVLESTQKRK